MGAKTVIVEELDIKHPDIKDEYNALSKYFKGKRIEFNAHRFTFVTDEVNHIDEVEDLPNDRFLSSAILINLFRPINHHAYNWKSYVFKAIVCRPKLDLPSIGRVPLQNHYIPLRKSFTCNIEISEDKTRVFDIEGTYFCQQNTITSVCAHAVLCMTINNSNSHDGQLITSENVNKDLGINHEDKKVKIGLDIQQIEDVLGKHGFYLFIVDFFENENFDYNWLVYGYLESRCPIILGFTTSKKSKLHVVSIFGHTLNPDLWEPEARIGYTTPKGRYFYRSTSEWVDHFIIHDDNMGMYMCMPISSIKRNSPPKKDPKFRAKYACAIIPQDVRSSFSEAELAAFIITETLVERLKNMGADLGKWIPRLFFSNRQLVIRTILITKNNYSKSLNCKDFDGNILTDAEKETILSDLPDRFWLSEISNPDLYIGSKNKLIDFIYPSQKAPNKSIPFKEYIKDNWIQIRMPNALFKNVMGDYNPFTLSTSSHYPLIEIDHHPFIEIDTPQYAFCW
jgi:hypothetical protein